MQELNGSHSHQNSIYYSSKCNRTQIFIQQVNRFSETLHCCMVWYFVIFSFSSLSRDFFSNENFLSIFGLHVPESTTRFTPIEVSHHHHQYALQSKQHSQRIYLFFFNLKTKHKLLFALLVFHSIFCFCCSVSWMIVVLLYFHLVIYVFKFYCFINIFVDNLYWDWWIKLSDFICVHYYYGCFRYLSLVWPGGLFGFHWYWSQWAPRHRFLFLVWIDKMIESKSIVDMPVWQGDRAELMSLIRFNGEKMENEHSLCICERRLVRLLQYNFMSV